MSSFSNVTENPIEDTRVYEELSVDDFFAQEVDQGEYDEVSRSLVVPAGNYYTTGDYPYRLDTREVVVTSVDSEGRPNGESHVIERRTLRFWGKVVNDEGSNFMLGLNVSPMAIYGLGSGADRQYFRKPVAGSKPDSATKHFHQAVKLFKKENNLGPSDPVAVGQITEFLQRTPLRLHNKVLPPFEEGGEPIAFVVGYQLA